MLPNVHASTDRAFCRLPAPAHTSPDMAATLQGAVSDVRRRMCELEALQARGVADFEKTRALADKTITTVNHEVHRRPIVPHTFGTPTP